MTLAPEVKQLQSDSVEAAIGGSGDVNYYGDPKTSSSVAGSGRIKQLGAAPQSGCASRGRRIPIRHRVLGTLP